MTDSSPDSNTEELTRRLEEAEETLRAIRSGEVDALVVEGAGRPQVYTLEGADHPYRVLVEAMQQGALTLSSDGTVLYCNECFAEMLDTPHEKIVGAVISRFLSVAHRQAFEAILRDGRTRSSQGEFELQAADGTLLPVYITIASLATVEAPPLSMVVTDLREQKKHQETDRRKDEFMAMLAHELRNPLAPIRSGLELLGLSDTADRETIELMRSQVDHLVRLVDDLLDVSRIVRGRIELRRVPVDLLTVIRRSVSALKHAVKVRRQDLSVSLPHEPIWLEADAVRLAQVIENLLSNASKYTHDGGRIELIAESRGGHAVIIVQDDGTGMEPHLLPKVFDLFVQSTRSLDRSQGGLGIGLTLVKKLVELHGGSVSAHSEGLGSGSHFVVQLPIAAATPRIEVQAPIAACQKGRRILVVDDNVGAANLLSRLISQLGPHRIETAYDGPRAVERAEQFRPDILLLDIGLPKMDGFAVARKLRANECFDGMLLVALTGYGREEDRRNSREAGFDAHLVKPVAVETLRELFSHPKLPSSASM